MCLYAYVTVFFHVYSQHHAARVKGQPQSPRDPAADWGEKAQGAGGSTPAVAHPCDRSWRRNSAADACVWEKVAVAGQQQQQQQQQLQHQHHQQQQSARVVRRHFSSSDAMASQKRPSQLHVPSVHHGGLPIISLTAAGIRKSYRLGADFFFLLPSSFFFFNGIPSYRE